MVPRWLHQKLETNGNTHLYQHTQPLAEPTAVATMARCYKKWVEDLTPTKTGQTLKYSPFRMRTIDCGVWGRSNRRQVWTRHTFGGRRRACEIYSPGWTVNVPASGPSIFPTNLSCPADCKFGQLWLSVTTRDMSVTHEITWVALLISLIILGSYVSRQL